MIKSVLLSLFAVALFAAGAIGSWYITNFQQANAGAADESSLTTDVEPVPAPRQTDTKLSQLATPVFPKALSGEDIFRFTAMNKKNLELLKQRREAIEQDEMRLRLAEQDLDTRKLEIEGILKQSQDTVAEAEQIISKLQADLATLKAEKEAAKTAPDAKPETTAEDAQANIKVSAEWLALMPPEKAAEQVKTLANDGKKELVLQLLGNLEGRVVANILDSLDDSQLGAELLVSFRDSKRPQKKKRR